jgi:flagellar basal body rod protein FlgB
MTINSLTIGAVGLALDIAQRAAEVSSHNVARANMPNARIEHADFGSALSLLDRVAHGDDVSPERLSHVDIGTTTTRAVSDTDASNSLDGEVADMALASAHFQALSEALNRQFGLMTIALSGDQV